MGMCAFRLASAGLALMASTVAGAQVSSRPDPFDVKTAALFVGPESSFKEYRRLDDQMVASWRGANKLAHELGGWKAFASGQVPDLPQPPASGATPKSARPQGAAPAGGHAGHAK